VKPGYKINRQAAPQWAEIFFAKDLGRTAFIQGCDWMRNNESQTNYVPAGVPLRVRFSAPYEEQYSPWLANDRGERSGRAGEDDDLRWADRQVFQEG